MFHPPQNLSVLDLLIVARRGPEGVGEGRGREGGGEGLPALHRSGVLKGDPYRFVS